MIQLSLAQARELAESILLHNGFNPAHARAVSDTVLAGERDGCASHGLYRLSGCVNSLRAGKAIPEGWGGDAQGRSSIDANVVLDSGAMLTFGGHKGSALAAMVELIAGPLIGDLTSAESLAWDAGSKSSPYHGELIIALDPQRFLGAATEQHLARAEVLFASIEGQGARLPSQRRYEARARSLVEGVQIPQALYRDLLALKS